MLTNYELIPRRVFSDALTTRPVALKASSSSHQKDGNLVGISWPTPKGSVSRSTAHGPVYQEITQTPSPNIQ